MTENVAGMGDQIRTLGEKEKPERPSPTKYADLPRSEQFDGACEAGRKIFIARNAEYGDSITSTGVLGATVELIGDVARLKNLVLKDPEFGKGNKEAIVERLKDIHNYANIALMMIGMDIWGPE